MPKEFRVFDFQRCRLRARCFESGRDVRFAISRVALVLVEVLGLGIQGISGCFGVFRYMGDIELWVLGNMAF